MADSSDFDGELSGSDEEAGGIFGINDVAESTARHQSRLGIIDRYFSSIFMQKNSWKNIEIKS